MGSRFVTRPGHLDPAKIQFVCARINREENVRIHALDDARAIPATTNAAAGVRRAGLTSRLFDVVATVRRQTEKSRLLTSRNDRFGWCPLYGDIGNP